MSMGFKALLASLLETIVGMLCIVLWLPTLGNSMKLYEELHDWLWEKGLTYE